MTPYIIGLGFTILVSIITVVYKYGVLNKKVDDSCDEHIGIRKDIRDLQDDIAETNKTLNKICGKIEIIIKFWERNGK